MTADGSLTAGERIDRLEDAVYHRLPKKCDDTHLDINARVETLVERVAKLEVRVALVCAIGSVAGSAIVQLIAFLLKG